MNIMDQGLALKSAFLGEEKALSHNSTITEGEPSWETIDKTKLPRQAFADQGEVDKKSTWGFPHHWVKGGTATDDNGVYTNGTMYLHRRGLITAWAAAQGARSGQEASSAVKAHLNVHREAIGLTEKQFDELAKQYEEDEYVEKPYANEHACRIRQPGDFQENTFSRMQREHDGKTYSIIMGRLKGETTLTEQAYRYDKQIWSEESARSHCREHKGNFEAAKK